ncbi:hypothetical protein LTS15_002781 [Exophiala xenobiotica]|nr:hypothetical protein LTS15_002781 [Exophiala xenobiotica]
MSFITLKYAKPDSCICSPAATTFVRSICPIHAVPVNTSQRRKRNGRAEEEEDEEYQPRRRRRVTLDKKKTTPMRPAIRTSSNKTIDATSPPLTSNDKKTQIIPRPQNSLTRPTPATSHPLTDDKKSTVATSPSVLLPGRSTEEAIAYFQNASKINRSGQEIGRSRTRSKCYNDTLARLKDEDWMTFKLLGENWKDFRTSLLRYLLVPPSKTITFTAPTSRLRRGNDHNIHTSILRLNRQVYREASSILYGENKFIATEPFHLFQPNGLQAFRRRTTGLIRELSFENRGDAAQMCVESRETILRPIWNMMLEHPALLSLKKLGIRREVIREADLNLFAFQNYLNTQGGGTLNAHSLFNKRDLILRTTAKLASLVAIRGSAFQDMYVVEQGDKEVVFPGFDAVINVIEICLTRGQDHGISGERLNLHREVMDMLFQDREAGLLGANREYHRYFGMYRDQLM